MNFLNKYDILDNNFNELVKRCMKYKMEIDDYELLMRINYVLGRDYYDKAKEWLDMFGDKTWWRDDLV